VTSEVDVQLMAGDMVFAGCAIESDGHVPGYEAGQTIARAGARGVVVRVGRVELELSTAIYAVRFESAPGELGPEVGCLATELRVERECDAVE
jgi:hypothetical protein